ncbi:hypothetical protein [Nitratireductor sp. StC3]|uniref:hypothetical protein n=1 Tax=Nitratireductor sp. StC3 TaxID=2126741 RepID=UPI0018EAC09A|nr:hypothetical protein [Nitratireductor sp. StC3]
MRDGDPAQFLAEQARTDPFLAKNVKIVAFYREKTQISGENCNFFDTFTGNEGLCHVPRPSQAPDLVR